MRLNQFKALGSIIQISKTRFFVWSSHVGRVINGSIRQRWICLLCNRLRTKGIFETCKIRWCRFCEVIWSLIFQCVGISLLTTVLACFDFRFLIMLCNLGNYRILFCNVYVSNQKLTSVNQTADCLTASNKTIWCINNILKYNSFYWLFGMIFAYQCIL